jgi:hypothetical protein
VPPSRASLSERWRQRPSPSRWSRPASGRTWALTRRRFRSSPSSSSRRSTQSAADDRAGGHRARRRRAGTGRAPHRRLAAHRDRLPPTPRPVASRPTGHRQDPHRDVSGRPDGGAHGGAADGREIGLIPRACAMARLLQPSMVILEDVDLVAEERDRQQPGCTPLLLELLNEMDGLGDDADVIFLLTSNRRRPVGAGLAARPGRVDLAGEAALPDPAAAVAFSSCMARALPGPRRRRPRPADSADRGREPRLPPRVAAQGGAPRRPPHRRVRRQRRGHRHDHRDGPAARPGHA